jgi:hypothetical protein
MALFATERKVGYVIRNLQLVVNSVAAWCKHWYIKINEEKTQAIYFSHRIRPHEFVLTNYVPTSMELRTTRKATNYVATW